MKFRQGDLVYVKYLGDNNIIGIIIDHKLVEEKNIIDDLWNTVIINKDILYKVLLHGKIVKITETFIQEKIT